MAGLNDTGFSTPRFQDVADEIRAEYVSREGSGRTPDWSRNRVLGLLTTIMALLLVGLWESLQQVYNSFRVNSATGEQLDNLCELVGVERQQATFSTVELEFSGTPGTIIPAGFVAETASGDRWITIEDGVVGGAAIARASETGEIIALAGTITEIVTAVSGLDSVTNPTAANVGRDRESDLELRLQRSQRLQGGTNRTLGGIRTALEDLNFIEAALVVENDGLADIVVDGITIPGKAFTPIVFPDTITAEQITQMAELIRDTKAGGIKSDGNATETVPTGAGDGRTIDIGYRFAVAVAVDYTVTTTPATGFTVAELTPEIETVLQDFTAQLRVGDDVLLLQVYRALAAIEGLEGAVVLINGSGADLNTAIDEFPEYNSATVS